MHPQDRQRFFYRWWRIEHLYEIQTKKAGKKIRLKLNPVQKMIRDKIIWLKERGRFVRILILKARQEGVWTSCLIYHLDLALFRKNHTAVILAHRRDSLKRVFRMIKIAYDSCPDRVRLAGGKWGQIGGK